MVKFRALILVLICICCTGAYSRAATANYDFMVDSVYFFKILDAEAGTVELAKPNSDLPYVGDFVIPDKVTHDGKTYTVVKIGSNAFSNRDLLTLTLPATIKTVGKQAISLCRNLTTITLNEGLECIDTMGISQCASLKEITIPSTVKSIKSRGFYGSSLTSINIPAACTDIGFEAFYSSSHLTSIIVDENNPVYSGNGPMLFNKDRTVALFHAPGDPATSISLPSTVHTIDAYCYHNNSKLTSVNIPDHVTQIGEWAFGECRYVQELNTGNGIKEIPAFAFGWFSRCTKLNIGTGVTEIAGNAFESLGSLVSKNMEPIVIPANVKHIGMGAFVSSGLTTLTLSEGIEVVDTLAFTTLSYLTQLNLPSTLREIRMLAFQSATKPTELNLPASVTYIGDGAFAGWKKLTSINISDKISYIGKRAFSQCTAMTMINVNESNPVYASRDGILFNKDFTELKTYPGGITDTIYTVPATVKALEGGCFSGSKYLREIVLHPDLSYGVGVFQDCSQLRRVNLPNTLTEIPEGTFLNCSQLLPFDLPSKLESIGYQAFFGCTKLTDVVIPRHVNSIGNQAWYVASRYPILKSVRANPVTPPVCTADGLTTITPFPENATSSSGVILYVPEGSFEAYSAAPGWKEFKVIVEDETLGVNDDVIDDNNAGNQVLTDGLNLTMMSQSATPASVWTLSGQCIYNGIAPTTIPLPASGIYVVRIGTNSFKIAVN